MEAAAAPLFSGANTQQMAAVECRAPLLYSSFPQAPRANAESSSIRRDASQVEVARQLAGLKQELENQRARAVHAEALLRAQVADQARSANTQPVGLGSVSGLGMDYTGSMGDNAVGSGLPSVPLPVPPVPKASSHPNPGIGLIQAKAPPPTREPLGLAGVLSGLIGCRTRSQSRGQGSSTTPADAQPSTAAVLEYCRRLLAEMETQTLTGMLQAHAGSQDVQSEQQSSQTSQSDQDEEEQDQVQLAASTSAVPHAPGEIRSREESFQALATVFQTALQVVRAAQHSSHPSGPQASLPSLAPPAQEEASQPQLALPAAQTSHTFPQVLQGINQAFAALSGTHASNAPDPTRSKATLRGKPLVETCASTTLLCDQVVPLTTGSICALNPCVN